MKTLINGHTLIAGIALFAVMVVVAFVVGAGISTEPASGTHAASPIAAPPDNVVFDPDADNFFQTDVMLRGYCYANTMLEDSKAFGGFGPSNNSARKVGDDLTGKGLYLLAQPTAITPFGGQPGMRVLLVNRTSKTLSFSACDSRLNIIQEAQDAEGNWLPIEYLPQSWCGNSYHSVYLKPEHYWALPAPRYRGHLPAKLRFTMILADGKELHSNEFEGSVNLGQFTIKEGHQGLDIMDPYEE